MKKLLLVLAAALVAVLLIWMIFTKPKTSPPDPEIAEARDVVTYLASEDFTKLPEAERTEFMSKLRELPPEKGMAILRADDVDDETRAKLRENMRGMRETMRTQMVDEARKFFKLSPEEQTAHLDKRIEEWEARRKEWEARRKEREARPDANQTDTNADRPHGPWRRGKPDPDQMQKFMQGMISNTTAEERAIMSEYFKRLHERRKELAGGR